MTQVTIDNNLVKKKKKRIWTEIRVALSDDGVWHTETCRRNVVNIMLYKYICGFSQYIRGVTKFLSVPTTICCSPKNSAAVK